MSYNKEAVIEKPLHFILLIKLLIMLFFFSISVQAFAFSLPWGKRAIAKFWWKKCWLKTCSQTFIAALLLICSATAVVHVWSGVSWRRCPPCPCALLFVSYRYSNVTPCVHDPPWMLPVLSLTFRLKCHSGIWHQENAKSKLRVRARLRHSFITCLAN